MPAAREPAARGGDQAAGRAVRWDEEARGDRAGDRGAAQVSPVRRADLGARSGERGRDRRAGRAAAGRAGGDVRGSFRVADRVALLWQAKIRAVGPPDEILASKDPAVLQFLERDLEMTLIQAESREGERGGEGEGGGGGGARGRNL